MAIDLRLVSASGNDRTPRLAEGVEKRQRPCGGTDNTGSLQQLLELFQRGGVERAPLRIVGGAARRRGARRADTA
jgi:hypothetical protein